MSRWRAHLDALVARDAAGAAPIGTNGTIGIGITAEARGEPLASAEPAAPPDDEDWTAVDAWLRGSRPDGGRADH
jgi:hypothetical protein